MYRNISNTPKYGFPLILITILYLSACQLSNGIEDVELANSQIYPLVDRDLWVHFQKFEQEALLRGYDLDLNLLEVTGTIEDIPEEGVAGVCVYGAHDHDVTIDQNFWNNSSNLIREYVVFHELGHCVLFQGHREMADSQGNCLSLMNSGTSGCRVAYNVTNRNFYIDELFDAIE